MNRHYCIPLIATTFSSLFNPLIAQTDNETLGTSAGAITNGDRNVLLGDFAAPSLTTSSENLISGAYTGWLINNDGDGSTHLAQQNVILGFRAAGAYTQSEWDDWINNSVALPDIGGTKMNFDQNVFIGYYAGLRNLTATDNVFIGAEAGMNNNASDNTFIGTEAGKNNTTGSDNTFIGEESGFSVTTGSDNTFIGQDAGSRISTGKNNTAIGDNAMGQASSSPNTEAGGASYANTVLGSEAGYDLGTGYGVISDAASYNNTFLGAFAGEDNGTGFVNTFVGAHAGTTSEFSDYCTFVGAGAGHDNNRTNESGESKGANRNTYLGTAAGFTNRLGSDNVALGCFADFGTWQTASQAQIDDGLDGDEWTKMAGKASGAVGGVNNPVNVNRSVTLGSYATCRRDNTVSIGFTADAIAVRSMAVGSGAQATHDDAFAIGFEAATHGDNIAVFGNETTASIDPGADGVTALGSSAYRYASANAKTYNAVADDNAAATMSFVADLGAEDDDSWRMQAADSGAFTISSFATSAYVDIISAANNGDVTVAGDLIVNSDGRLKEKVRSIGNALDILEQVEGKTYNWKPELGRDDRTHYGLIAQEVEAAVPELVSTNETSGVKSVNYQGFVPILINAVDELKEQNLQQREANLRQEKELKLLREQISLQQKLLEKLSAQ